MTIEITESDEIFLKKFLKYFCYMVINTDDFNTFEDTLTKRIKNVIENYDTNPENFLNMMQSHKNHQIWFTSFVGFFYHHGIGCDINRNMALKLYSLSNNLDGHLHLIKENGREVCDLQNFNMIIGKYLLSLFYYKDIILVKKTSINKRISNISNINKFGNFKSIFTKKNF